MLFSNGQLQRGSSGTSHQASSVLQEHAGIVIAEEYGSKPTVETSEKAIRAGKKSLLLMGQRVDIEPYLKRVSDLLSANKLGRSRASKTCCAVCAVLRRDS